MDGALTTQQLRKALDAAAELTAIRALDEFPVRVAAILRRLVPTEHTGYSAIDMASGRATVVADPAECVFAGGEEALARFAHQNPIVMRARGGDQHVLRLSDFITQRALHRTDIYNEVYRHASLEYQLGLPLTKLSWPQRRPGEVIGVSLARLTRDFSGDEKLLLGLLKPHLVGTLERLHEWALLRALTAGEDGAHNRLVLLVDPADGVVAWLTDAAQRLLDLEPGAPLPDELRAWLEAEARSETWVRLAGRRMRAQLVRHAYGRLDALHLSPVSPIDIGTLRALGFTRRQAEVHVLAMQGLTAHQIADALGLSRRTIEKHLEAVYARLGVTNRAQAIVATLDAIQGAREP